MIFLFAIYAGKGIHLPSVMGRMTLVIEGQTLLPEDDDGMHGGAKEEQVNEESQTTR